MTQHIDPNYAVARHPIYHVDGDIFGYELLYRSVGCGNVATFPSDTEATLSVLAHGIHAISQDIAPGKRIFINFPKEILEAGHHRFLDTARYVIEILEHVTCDAAFTELVQGIKEAGYVLALDDYVGDSSFDPILPYVTFIKLDFLALKNDPNRRAAVADRCLRLGKTVLAEKVETAADINWCRARGVPLAQGYFYSRPQVVTTKVLEVNQAVKLNLMAEISRPELDVRRIRDIIGSDISLTYKLLRYVNTASLSGGRSIESLDFAITRLGQNALASWAAVNLLAQLGSTPQDRELAFASAVRARFLALANARRCHPCRNAQSTCLLGLFSLLDAILAIPMAQALAGIPINTDVKTALLGGQSACTSCLTLIASYDKGGSHALAGMQGLGRLFRSAVLGGGHVPGLALVGSLLGFLASTTGCHYEACIIRRLFPYS